MLPSQAMPPKKRSTPEEAERFFSLPAQLAESDAGSSR